MLKMQNKNNSVVHKEWLEKGWPFMRAAVVEGVEAMDHVGWKWWKDQPQDIKQVQLELIDIWHFILSKTLVDFNGSEQKASEVLITCSTENRNFVRFDECEYSVNNIDLVRKFELMVGLAVSRRCHLGLFQSIMLEVGLDWESLLKIYIGKNVLNQFRQKNGYKDGSYRKNWMGREDNVHLSEILEEVEPSENLEYEIYEKLEMRYSEN